MNLGAELSSNAATKGQRPQGWTQHHSVLLQLGKEGQLWQPLGSQGDAHLEHGPRIPVPWGTDLSRENGSLPRLAASRVRARTGRVPGDQGATRGKAWSRGRGSGLTTAWPCTESSKPRLSQNPRPLMPPGPKGHVYLDRGKLQRVRNRHKLCSLNHLAQC